MNEDDLPTYVSYACKSTYVSYACKYGHRTSNVIHVPHSHTTVWYCLGCRLHYRSSQTAISSIVECITQKEYDLDVTMALL